MKTFRRLSVMVLGILMIMSSLTVSAGTKVNQDVLDARDGVVRVIYETSDGYYMGSAFGVGHAGQETDTFITCYHVVNPDYDVHENYKTVYITTGESIYSDSYEIEVLYADAGTDIAILRTKQRVKDRVALPIVASSNIEATMQVYALGFPGISDEISDTTYYNGDFSSKVEDETITTGIITKTSVVSEGVKYYQIDADINHGNSGGPTVTEQGYVIGINDAIAADSQGGNYLGFVTHIDYAMDALDSLDVNYDVISAEEFAGEQESVAATAGAADGMSTAVYALIAVVAVVMFVLITFMIIMVKRDKKREAQVAREREQYMQRSRVENFQSAQVVMGAPKVIGVQGMFANKSFTVTGSMVMGRSSSRCHLVYPQETPGVSNVHCELRIMNGALFLIDRGSSYGTFVNNGQIRLNADQPYQLHNGELFWLAAPQNSFVARM